MQLIYSLTCFAEAFNYWVEAFKQDAGRFKIVGSYGFSKVELCDTVRWRGSGTCSVHKYERFQEWHVTIRMPSPSVTTGNDSKEGFFWKRKTEFFKFAFVNLVIITVRVKMCQSQKGIAVQVRLLSQSTSWSDVTLFFSSPNFNE